jgi:colanic acid biosynthesis protein WcaH
MPLAHDAFLDVVRHTPLVSIDLVVTNDRGEVLLGLRNNEPAKGYWFVPGGRIRKNEPLDGAFDRIVNCELGIRRSRAGAKLIGAFEHMYDSNFAEADDVPTHYVVLAHHLKIPSDTILLPDTQHDELRWWPIADAIKSDNVHRYSRDYLDQIDVPRAMVAMG